MDSTSSLLMLASSLALSYSVDPSSLSNGSSSSSPSSPVHSILSSLLPLSPSVSSSASLSELFSSSIAARLMPLQNRNNVNKLIPRRQNFDVMNLSYLLLNIVTVRRGREKDILPEIINRESFHEFCCVVSNGTSRSRRCVTVRGLWVIDSGIVIACVAVRFNFTWRG